MTQSLLLIIFVVVAGSGLPISIFLTIRVLKLSRALGVHFMLLLSVNMIPQPDATESHKWFMLLGVIVSMMAMLSIIPNLAIIVILCRKKITSDALINFRSCACADVIAAGLFLVFVCPSWFHGSSMFNLITCSVEGVVSQWIGLALHYSLVYIIFQRYHQSRNAIGWKESKAPITPILSAIWLLTGVAAALPYIQSMSAYAYDINFCHCVLNGRLVLFIYDVLLYLIPSFLLFTAGTLLSPLHSKPVRRIKAYRRYSSTYSPKVSLLGRDSLSFSLQEYIEMRLASKEKSNSFLKVNLNGLMVSSLENSMMGLETRLTFIYIAYTSSLIILVAFVFRMYGLWSDPLCRAALAASHIFIFAAGITRSIIPLLVSQAATKHFVRASRKQAKLEMKANRCQTHRRTSGRRDTAGFTSFSLFMLSARGGARTHNRRNREMEAFWFDDNCNGLKNVSVNRSSTTERSLNRALLSTKRKIRKVLPERSLTKGSKRVVRRLDDKNNRKYQNMSGSQGSCDNDFISDQNKSYINGLGIISQIVNSNRLKRTKSFIKVKRPRSLGRRQTPFFKRIRSRNKACNVHDAVAMALVTAINSYEVTTKDCNSHDSMKNARSGVTSCFDGKGTNTSTMGNHFES